MQKSFVVLTILAGLMLSLAACGNVLSEENEAPAEQQAAPSETAEPAAESGRQDGERFEAVIMLEGMEETVQYEHVVNETAGFEMDYDYESFVRQSGSDRERFLSLWDAPEAPENYLEVAYRSESVDTVAATVREELSKEYDLNEETRTLDGAGDCLFIEASAIKGTNQMAEKLQEVYIIPAADGCRVATAHFSIESAEGFGRRFSYMMNTLRVIDRSGERKISDEEALAAIEKYCIANNPALEGIVNAGEYPVSWEIVSSDENEIVVLFRSYTGSETRYYIDRISGYSYVTEFVSGITPEEERAEESVMVWDYVG